MQTRRSGRIQVFLTLVLAVILASVMWPSRTPRKAPPARSEAAAPTAGPTAEMPHETPRSPSLPMRAAAPPPAADPPPVIDEVLVEKPEVCSGEENLITVRAHTVNGTDAFLHYVVDGAMGSSVPLKLLLGADGRVEGQHVISVFGRTNTAVTVPVPEYKVKDCQPERVVAVESHVQPNSWSDLEFGARIVTLPPPNPGVALEGSHKAFVAASYAWSFGDGETATTSGPFVTHDFGRRAQDTLYSYFAVQVDVRSADGELLSGRTTLPLINPAFEAFARKGIVQLLIALDPRFPELGPDGRVVQNVRLWHTRPEAVTIDAAAVTKYFEDASGESQPQALDGAALLGTTTVPPGKDGIVTSVVLDTIADPGVFSMTYRLSGHSSDGHPVMGSFSVLRPPPRPTADNSQAVVDSKLKAKILAAREMLGKETVNDEDLWRLEREGRFAGLAVTDEPVRPSGPSAAPPSMPGPGIPSVGPPVPTGVTAPPAATVPGTGEPPTTK